MSAATSYSALLEGMWGPDGSEINDRLKKLQELERMRKEREAKRQEMLKDSSKTTSSTSAYRSRLRSRDEDPQPSRSTVGLRRTISLRGSEDSDTSYGNDRYGGARPKFSSYSDASDQEDDRPITDIFSDITASVIGSRPGYSGYSRSYSNQDNNDSDIFSGIVRSVTRYKPGSVYERRPYNSRYNSGNSTNYSTDINSYTFKQNYENQDDYANEQYSADNEGSQGEQQQEVNEVQEHEFDDDVEGEEPRHFIERLKNQNTNDYGIHSKRSANHDHRVSTMPTIPPYKKSKGDEEEDSVDPSFDILSVAKDIRATFGVKSPKTPDSKTETFEFLEDGTCLSEQSNGDFVFLAKSANAAANKPRRSSNKRKSTKPIGKSRESTNFSSNSNIELYTNGNIDYNNQGDVSYEIIEAEYNSSEDEGREPLPESAFATETSDWNLTTMTPNKLDLMQEFFTGEEAGEDPEIYRELNGSMVRAEMERAILEMSQNTPSNTHDKSTRASSGSSKSLTKSFDEQYDSKSVSSDSRSTPEKDGDDAVNTSQEKGKGSKKKTKSTKNKSRIEQIKTAKSSDSDNDSFKTASESESDTKVNQTAKKEKTSKRTPVNKQAVNKTPSSTDKGLSLSDKLAKLESMTQEKSRKQSISESDSKKPLPGYMAGTSASQKKQAKAEPAKADKGLVKNVREIKKFVRENSVEPMSPNTTPLKSQISKTNEDIVNNVLMNDSSVQTDPLLENTVEVYVCKHCGKSSEDPVERPRTPSSLSTNARISNNKKVLERNNSVDSTASKSNGMKSNFSSSRESLLSNESSSTFTEERKYAKSKNANLSRSYMKGTASSKLKTAKEQEGQKQNGVVTRSVLQRAKALESAAKPSARTNKPISRSRPTSPHNLALVGKLSKAKSVEQMELIRNHVEAEKNDQNNNFERNFLRRSQRKDMKSVKAEKDKKAEQVNEKPIEKTQEKQSEQTQEKPVKQTQEKPLGEHPTRAQTLQKKVPPPISPKPKKKVDAAPLEKLDITPLSPRSIAKPPVISPGTKQVSSPKSPADETSVESKGQFTKLVDNPFIRNDAVKRSNSLREGEESVWEKAEHRSRDSSLRRSSSSIELDNSSRSPSAQRSKSDSQEKSSLTQLSWSGSGSSSSLHGSTSNLRGSKSSLHGSTSNLRGSKSSLHDSNSSLNDSVSAFRRSRSLSANSQTSQSSVLNLLTSPGSTRNPSSGAIETDVDAAYDNFVKENNNNNEKFLNQQKHDEESVNKAHLEFAKQALNMLEFETIKRDSSNESDKDTRGKRDKLIENQGDDNISNGSVEEFQRQQSKKDRKGKGFLKGKFFRK